RRSAFLLAATLAVAVIGGSLVLHLSRSDLARPEAAVFRVTERPSTTDDTRWPRELRLPDAVASSEDEVATASPAGEREVVRSPVPSTEAEAPRTDPPAARKKIVEERALLELQAAPPARLRDAGAMDYRSQAVPPSTGGTAEPNDQPYGDMFFESYGVNPFVDTEDDNLSTFGLDVDTGSYAVARRYVQGGHLPPAAAVRLEEFVNYFDYGDAPPSRGDFAVHLEGAPAPFAEGPRYQLLRVGIRARDVVAEERPPATLIFVVDVSGSMARENRLGLVQQSLGLLLGELGADDRVGLVIYGSTGRILLEPTGDHEAIRSAIERLAPGGSTNAEEGLVLAYGLAERFFRDGAINRIVLCSDGVANVGRTGPDSILERIGTAAENGIELTTVGFGMGNYNDVLMEQLADRGDGSYAYVDSLPEARRVFVENLTGMLQTVAREAKVQVEFDKDAVERYRLLGYENRDIADEDFRDDSVDAGEIGAGHTVTALYEIKLAEEVPPKATLATVRLRHHSVERGEVVETAETIRRRDLAASWDVADPGLRLAAVVAEFAEILRRSYWAKDGDLDALFAEAQRLSAAFPGDLEVAELVTLIGRAARLDGQRRGN
ncbi:MAG: von Willebrand factor type A domain-containing protein, partial [Thermoanaerobaculia bacterium]|nr:von Willebrand factor type A domain-containing protein [Thermoanaerobaculia bacterium]